MPKSPLTIAVVCVGLALSGCAASPWSAGQSSPTASASLAAKPPTSPSPATQADAATMQQVMAEVQELGATDPAAQNRLMEDLRQSDPSLWPLVMQQFRATLAYRRQASERLAATRVERLPPIGDPTASFVARPQAELLPIDSTDAASPLVEPSSSQVAQVSYTAPMADGSRQPAAEPVAKPAEAVPLAVRHLAFCTEVQSYGCTKRFAGYDFRPNQEVLLYAEVDDFVSEPTADGYHTTLMSRYQIVDEHDRPVAEQTFAATEDLCQNQRRDFFIGYHLHWPKDIAPGKYALRLSIEDLKGQRTGQASIEFSIKSAD
jgi:hypothetical protein